MGIVAGVLGVLLGAAVLGPWPAGNRVATLAGSLLVLGVGVASIVRPGWLVLSMPWTLDPVRGWFWMVLGLVATASAIYLQGYRSHGSPTPDRWLRILFPAFVAAMAAVVAANTVFGFLTAWEVMALLSFFLVVLRNTPEARRAGYVYLVMSHLSGLFVLAGFLMVMGATHTPVFAAWPALLRSASPAVRLWAPLLLTVGFAIKSGIVPFHVWLPRAHPVAPTPVSALMSGAMIKLGPFGVLVLALRPFGAPSAALVAVLLAMGALSSLLGVLYALMEHDLKRLLAYHSIENIGIIYLGLGVYAAGERLGLPLWMAFGLAASLFHVLNHAVFKSQLFFVAGAVERATGTLDADRLGGLFGRLPVAGWAFLLGSMAISGLPPFNGFVSEWLTMRGLLLFLSLHAPAVALAGLGLAAVLALTGALAGACFVKATGVVFLGQPRSPVPVRPVPPVMEWVPLGLGGISLVLGVLAGPVLTRVGVGLGGAPAWAGLTAPLALPLTALLLLGLVAVLFVLVQPCRVKTVPRWACGSSAAPDMQYTGAAFTQAIGATFAVLYRPRRQVTREGPHGPWFPVRIRYAQHTTPIWEHYLYRPAHEAVFWVSRQMSRLQAGPIRLYLLYLMATVGLLLLAIR